MATEASVLRGQPELLGEVGGGDRGGPGDGGQHGELARGQAVQDAQEGVAGAESAGELPAVARRWHRHVGARLDQRDELLIVHPRRCSARLRAGLPETVPAGLPGTLVDIRPDYGARPDSAPRTLLPRCSLP